MSELSYNLRSEPSFGGTSAGGASARAELDPARFDPDFYGWRWRHSTSPSGEPRMERTPRTREEFLNPQEGDEMGQDSLHWRLLVALFNLFEMRYPLGGEITVFADFLIRFQLAGKEKNAAPDLVLMRGVEEPQRRRKSFRMGKEPGEILLAIEIVSPEYAFKDYEHNPRLFAQAKIPEYLIIDPPPAELERPCKLSGYRLDPVTGSYRAIVPGAEGRIHSRSADLDFVPDAEGGFFLVDGQSGERLARAQDKNL